VPKSTQLYSKLSADQQEKFNDAVVDKLRSIIGGLGDLAVLAEYIKVMLQSNRPPDQIQSELEAFLQEESRPFTNWLCDHLAKCTGDSSSVEVSGDALLTRTVRNARQSSGIDSVGEKTKRKDRAQRADGVERCDRVDKEHQSSRNRDRRGNTSTTGSATAAGTVSAQVPAVASKMRSENHRSRSRQRSRQRRRRREAWEADAAGPTCDGEAPKEALPEGHDGNKTDPGLHGDERSSKAILTPNVQFLREAYHQNIDIAHHQNLEGQPVDTRWSFRAEPALPPQPSAEPIVAPAHVTAPPPMLNHPGQVPHAPYGYYPGPAPGPAGPPVVVEHLQTPPPARPRPTSGPGLHNFAMKKWRVVRMAVVRATEQLSSEEVQRLQVGEIVEQVAPTFKLQNGIIRIQIRHPSSPQFPNPIGWVTQDATAAHGPKFLEPGPEPMTRGTPWRMSPPWSGAGPWRPRGPMAGNAPTAIRTPGPTPARGPNGFQNLTWKPQGSEQPSGA